MIIYDKDLTRRKNWKIFSLNNLRIMQSSEAKIAEVRKQVKENNSSIKGSYSKKATITPYYC